MKTENIKMNLYANQFLYPKIDFNRASNLAYGDIRKKKSNIGVIAVDMLELYKKEIELFLSTLGIYKGDKEINKNEQLNAENKKFIKEKMMKIHSGNFDEDVLNMAIDQLLPYLYQKD